MLGASLLGSGELVRKGPGMVEETEMSAWRPSIRRTLDEVRRYDLRQRHVADSMRASLKRFAPQTWQMFQQEGSVVGNGRWRDSWCVYPSNADDPLYEDGLWFNDEAAATACLTWKRERAQRRPWAVTRAIVRAWRALPWR